MEDKLRILIVDDDAGLAANLQDTLGTEGHSTATAEDAGTALHLCHEQPFDLGLIDLKLPDMSGTDLIQELARLSPGMEYIISTGHASAQTAIEAVGWKRVIAYHTKPLDMGYLLTVIAQVAERRRAEEALREETRLCRILLDSLPCVALLLRPNTREIVAANRAAIEAGAAPGTTCFEAWPRRTEPCPWCLAPRLWATGESQHCEPEHEGVFYDAHWVPIDGDLYMHYAFDVTERKRGEQESQRIERLEAVGTLAGGIAHDFNNLLTGIMGNISLARRYVGAESKADERLLQAERASERARDLTQQLLTFSRGGAPIRKVVALARVVDEAVTFALRGSNIGQALSFPDALWPVETDEGQIIQVITNLVINANEAMPEGGTVSVRARNVTLQEGDTPPLSAGDYVELTVTDHGVGIAENHLPRVFEPYFTTKQAGSGLGLATAHSIVRNHGGHITVRSQLGAWTEFSVYLPASKRTALAEEEAGAEALTPATGKVLVMDDEATIRELLSRALSEVGHQVELAKDGAEAVAMYARAMESGRPFDVVILDLTVPGGVGGREAMRKLLEIDPDVRAIVSSGYSTDPVMSDFGEYGFSAVIAKPYRVTEIREAVRRVLAGDGKGKS